MPDFGRVKYCRDGMVVVTGTPGTVVGRWEKDPREGWNVACSLPGLEGETVNALPRSSADRTVKSWLEAARAAPKPEDET